MVFTAWDCKICWYLTAVRPINIYQSHAHNFPYKNLYCPTITSTSPPPPTLPLLHAWIETCSETQPLYLHLSHWPHFETGPHNRMTVTWHTQRVKGASGTRVPRDQGNGCQRSLNTKYLAHQLPLGKSNMAGKSLEIPLKMRENHRIGNVPASHAWLPGVDHGCHCFHHSESLNNQVGFVWKSRGTPKI